MATLTPQQDLDPNTRPDPRLYNADLAPTLPAQRTWRTWNYIALWFSMSMEVTTYMLAASLIAGGMNPKQAILTILLGNLIVLVPMLLNAHAGAKYGIPFPVFVRASFGTRGANIPAVLRAIVACGWFGIQSWIGGQAIAQMVNIIAPSTTHSSWLVPVCFLAFWLLNMAVVWRGVNTIRRLQSFSVPFMLLMSGLLLGFMLHKAGGFGPMLSAPSRFHTRAPVLALLPSLIDSNGRLLGHPLPQHPRLHPLRPQPGVPTPRPGLRPPRRDGPLLRPRHRRHLRLHRSLRPPNLVPRRTPRPLPPTRHRLPRPSSPASRHSQRQHRRQRSRPLQ